MTTTLASNNYRKGVTVQYINQFRISSACWSSPFPGPRSTPWNIPSLHYRRQPIRTSIHLGNVKLWGRNFSFYDFSCPTALAGYAWGNDMFAVVRVASSRLVEPVQFPCWRTSVSRGTFGSSAAVGRSRSDAVPPAGFSWYWCDVLRP